MPLEMDRKHKKKMMRKNKVTTEDDGGSLVLPTRQELYRTKVFHRITSTTRSNSSLLEACIRHHLWQGELAVRRGGALIIPKQQPQKKKKKKTTSHYSSKPPSYMPSSPSHHIIQHREEEEVFWDAPQEQEVDDAVQNPTNVLSWNRRRCLMEWTTHGIGLVSLVGYFIVTNAVQ